MLLLHLDSMFSSIHQAISRKSYNHDKKKDGESISNGIPDRMNSAMMRNNKSDRLRSRNISTGDSSSSSPMNNLSNSTSQQFHHHHHNVNPYHYHRQDSSNSSKQKKKKSPRKMKPLPLEFMVCVGGANNITPTCTDFLMGGSNLKNKKSKTFLNPYELRQRRRKRILAFCVFCFTIVYFFVWPFCSKIIYVVRTQEEYHRDLNFLRYTSRGNNNKKEENLIIELPDIEQERKAYLNQYLHDHQDEAAEAEKMDAIYDLFDSISSHKEDNIKDNLENTGQDKVQDQNDESDYEYSYNDSSNNETSAEQYNNETDNSEESSVSNKYRIVNLPSEILLHPNGTTQALREIVAREGTNNTNLLPPCPRQTQEKIFISLVLQSTPDRLWIVEEICHSWNYHTSENNPIILVVYNDNNHNEWQSQYSQWTSSSNETSKDNTVCPNLQIYSINAPIVLGNDKPFYYPINKLRNIGLMYIQTSHFMVMDIDFVPSFHLSSFLHSYLQQTHHDDEMPVLHQSMKKALVIPAFQYGSKSELQESPCSTTRECQDLLKKKQPKTISELKSCISDNNCIVFQSDNNRDGHSTTRSYEWLKLTTTTKQQQQQENSSVQNDKITCFESLRYEPYVVLPSPSSDLLLMNHHSHCSSSTHHSETPFYDERFHGYGKNKIQYISHLRYLGFQFIRLPLQRKKEKKDEHDNTEDESGFIIHFPHPESKVKKLWNNNGNNQDSQINTLHQDMDKLYPEFLYELHHKYIGKNGKDIVPLCKKRNKHTS